MAKFQYHDPERRHPTKAVVFMEDNNPKNTNPQPWAVFEDGLLETDDEKIIERLRSAEHVTEVTEAPAQSTEAPPTQTA